MLHPECRSQSSPNAGLEQREQAAKRESLEQRGLACPPRGWRHGAWRVFRDPSPAPILTYVPAWHPATHKLHMMLPALLGTPAHIVVTLAKTVLRRGSSLVATAHLYHTHELNEAFEHIAKVWPVFT